MFFFLISIHSNFTVNITKAISYANNSASRLLLVYHLYNYLVIYNSDSLNKTEEAWTFWDNHKAKRASEPSSIQEQTDEPWIGYNPSYISALHFTKH